MQPRRSGRGEDAVSPVIGVILMVAITVTLAAVVFFLVSNLSDQKQADQEHVAFRADRTDDTLTVAKGPDGAPRDWSSYTVTGCSTVPSGDLNAGDEISGCSGIVTVVDAQTNTLVYRGEFS